MFKRISTRALTLALAGCAGPSLDTRLPADHPANADAPESPLPAVSQTLTGAPHPQSIDSPGDPGTATTHQHRATTTPTTYVCPMHKQITSDRPGACPICHMKLVPNIPHDAATHGAHE